MGQILKRIAGIARANWNSKHDADAASNFIESQDDDLKKQFDNLKINQGSKAGAQRSETAQMDFPTALGVLGLSQGNPSPDEVKQAYRSRVAEYHPDKTAHLGPEIRDLAEKKILQINLAYEFLKKSMNL